MKTAKTFTITLKGLISGVPLMMRSLRKYLRGDPNPLPNKKRIRQRTVCNLLVHTKDHCPMQMRNTRDKDTIEQSIENLGRPPMSPYISLLHITLCLVPSMQKRTISSIFIDGKGSDPLQRRIKRFLDQPIKQDYKTTQYCPFTKPPTYHIPVRKL